MKIVLFSSSDFFIDGIYGALSESKGGHKISDVIYKEISPTLSQKLISSGVEVIRDAGFDDENFNRMLKKYSADLFVVVSFGRIFTGEFFRLPAKGAVNVHFSALPSYRGAAPVEWAIYNGEKETGITVFFINEKLDEGDIILRRIFEIRPFETARVLRERLFALSSGILKEALDELSKPGFKAQPQKGKVSFAPLLRKEMGKVDFSADSANMIFRKIIAFSDKINIYTFYRGKRVILKDASETTDGGKEDIKPGCVFEFVKGVGFKVRCTSGSLFVKEVKPEGGRQMSAFEFAIGQRITLGDIFK